MTKKNNQKSKISKTVLYLFFMTPQEVSLSDIYEVLKEEKWLLEYWKEMQVLEITLSSENTLDLEGVDSSRWAGADMEFQRSWQIEKVYSVTGYQEDLLEIKDCFQIIRNSFGGFLCTDSEDFKPFILEAR